MQAAGDHRLWLAGGTLPGGETAQLATAALPLMQGLQYARPPGHCTASTTLGLQGSHCSAAGIAHDDSGSADSVTGITLLQIFSVLVDDQATLQKKGKENHLANQGRNGRFKELSPKVH